MGSSLQICIFCSSSPHVPDVFQGVARDVGRLCAELGFDVVYGGAKSGLMGLVADSALAEGARVVGVMPECLGRYEHMHQGLSELIVTSDLHERQKIMAERSDLFLVLPGGMGTLAEFFEVLTWRQIGLHQKKIILLNVDGYWDSLIDMIEQMYVKKFLYHKPLDLFDVVSNLDDLKKTFPHSL